MSRFLFVSLPLTGHVNPMAAVAKTLSAQGHDVAWAGSESYLRPLVGPEAVIEQIPLRPHRRPGRPRHGGGEDPVGGVHRSALPRSR